MKKLDDSALLVARVLMPILFIVAGYGKLGAGYAGTQQYMAAMGVPGFLLPLTILLEVGGGLAVLFGLLTRSVALITVVFTLLTAFIFHADFTQAGNQINFMKNLTIAGGYLLLAVSSPGAFSIDRLLAKKG
ncbi:Inner membrane protein YqjF [Candidatus Sodalis pierantonius str. SOPE]|uniref:Inner membrane protein YqjF n=1 Tax=Candidatus Sodalis pierantonii str. SOPE TaxID=2342 RepID=W0HKE7_9GAMM|nr:DoxX family protein [Candidatus Sodalis pierantonius]AHF72932.1 Inner membrane protein YqjF [Candidatus Sodalis pierantonius str. SOPE]